MTEPPPFTGGRVAIPMIIEAIGAEVPVGIIMNRIDGMPPPC
jgi:hypothetical protein